MTFLFNPKTDIRQIRASAPALDSPSAISVPQRESPPFSFCDTFARHDERTRSVVDLETGGRQDLLNLQQPHPFASLHGPDGTIF